jgi:hypothetical protein
MPEYRYQFQLADGTGIVVDDWEQTMEELEKALNFGQSPFNQSFVTIGPQLVRVDSIIGVKPLGADSAGF